MRGLCSLNKRKAILMWLIKQKADIVFLQETYSSLGKLSGRAKCYFRTALVIVGHLSSIKVKKRSLVKKD